MPFGVKRRELSGDGFDVARLTIKVYQKGVWETVQVRGNDGVTTRQTRFNPNKLHFAGGKGFQADIPIGRDAPLVLPVTLVHPGTEASRLIFLFKDYRPGDWGVLGIIATLDAHTFNMQRMEFPLEFRLAHRRRIWGALPVIPGRARVRSETQSTQTIPAVDTFYFQCGSVSEGVLSG